MNKKELSERDICTKFITPALTAGGKWDLLSQIREEVYFTKGRVIVRGQLSTRGEAKRADYRTKETADLFLVLIVHLLRDGGHGAIVLPDGTLFGEGIKTRIKQELLQKCNLHTIVRLPNGVFAPYTGIKTNLLFFTKGEPTKEIWYYEHPYPPGVKSYNKTKPIRIEEFETERKWWGKPGQESKRKETEFAWRVSIADIAARGYNLDVKNPHTVDDAHRDPAELLVEYQRAQAAVAEVREKLRRELETALTTNFTEHRFRP
jgi:type I restriction enzyme M protein